jgi:WD40 repeat protein
VRDDLTLTHTHTRGTRPHEVSWVALSNDPEKVYTLERSADGSATAIVTRRADTFAELERLDAEAFGLGFGLFEFLVSGDGRWVVTILQEDVWYLCIRDRSLDRTTRVEIPDGARTPAVRWVTDGETVVVETRSGEARLFDVRRAEALGTFKGMHVESSDDGALIALCNAGHVTLVRHREAEALGRWPLRFDDMECLAAISQNPVGVWCIDHDREAPGASRLWWCEPGRAPVVTGTLPPHEKFVAMRLVAGRLTLATARSRVLRARPDGDAVVFEEDEGDRRGPGVVGAFVCDGFSPDGQRCAGRIGLVAAQIDLARGDAKAWGDGPSSRVAAIAVSRDGRSIGVVWSGGDVAVLDADTLDARWTFEVDDGPLIGCAFSPDGRVLYTLTRSRVRTWDLSEGIEISALSLPRRMNTHHRGGRIQVSPEGRHLLIGGSEAEPDAPTAWLLVDLVSGSRVSTSQRDAWVALDASFTAEGGVVVIESTQEGLTRNLRAVALDLQGQRVRADRLLRKAQAAEAISRITELDQPSLVDEGRALVGAPWTTDANAPYLRWDLEANARQSHTIPAGTLLAHGGGLGAFLMRGGVRSHGGRLVLRDLATMHKRGAAPLAPGDQACAAALVSDRAVVVGLADSRLLRFSIDAITPDATP